MEITTYLKWQEPAEHEEDLGVSVWVETSRYGGHSYLSSDSRKGGDIVTTCVAFFVGQLSASCLNRSLSLLTGAPGSY